MEQMDFGKVLGLGAKPQSKQRYKINADLRSLTTTQGNLGKALGLTQPRINQLIEEGVVVRDERDTNGAVLVFQSIKNFFQSHKITEEGIDYWEEKGKRERVNRQRDELKLQRENGAVYDAREVETAFIEMLTILKNQLLGIPAKYASQLEGKTRAEIYEYLTAELEGLLQELSDSYKQQRFDTEVVDTETGEVVSGRQC